MKARRRTRQARTTVIAAPIVLLLLNVGLVVLLQRRSDLRDPLYYGKENKLAEQMMQEIPGRITVVAIGSSRTANAFHPPTAEQSVRDATGHPCFAFNGAVLGRGPLFQLLHVQRLLARGIRPDIIVVEIVPSLFDAAGGRPSEIGHIRPDRLTRDEVETLARLGFADPAYLNEWRESMLNPWFAFRFQILGLLQPKWTPPQVISEGRVFPDPTGWQPFRGRAANQPREKLLDDARSGHQQHLMHMQPGEAAIAALTEVLDLCRREGITAVVVLAPESSDFRSWYGPAATATVLRLLDIARAGASGRVVDARAWLPDEAFADGHHMYDDAAPAYTARLVRELIVPAWRERSTR